MKKESKMPFDKSGLAHGYWECYYDNGNLFYKGYFIHGKRHGYCERYYNNGKLSYEGNFYMDEKLYQTTKNKIIL